MEFTSVPIIVLISYIVGELYKAIFKNKQEVYKLIPILVGVVGGVLGVIIYYKAPELIFYADNVWKALGVGIVSGISATGTNQIIKQIKEGQKKEDGE